MRVSAAFLLPIAVLASQVTPATKSTEPTSLLQPSSSQQSTNTAAFSIQTAFPADSPYTEDELRKRQTAAVVTTQAATVATQANPVTTYFVYASGGAEVPIVYTQLFSAVPEQWDGPTTGSIGLGTITGQVGVVKTKRNFIAAATDAVKNVEKRKIIAGRAASTNDGGILTPPGYLSVILAGVIVFDLFALAPWA